MSSVLSATTYQNALEHGAWVNLSDRAKLQVLGGDRVRFLNGQVTQNMKTLDLESTAYTCVTNLKGKIQFDAVVHAEADSLWVDAHPEQQEALFARLDRYLIADDAELQDVQQAWQLWHFFAPQITAIAPVSELPEGAKIRRSQRVAGTAGWDLWVPATLDWKPSDTHLVLEPEAFESFRILQGTPAFPNELNEDIFPQEAGLEASVMDFHKGCYIGQEILSRIKMSGKMPKQLVRFSLKSDGTPMESLKQLAYVDANGETQVLGPITSWALHPLTLAVCGMAYLRHQAVYPFSLLIVDEHLPKIPDEVLLIAL